MGHKALFLLGIALTHGVIAVVLASEDGSPERAPLADACARAPADAPHFAPPRELLAYAVLPEETGHGVIHP